MTPALSLLNELRRSSPEHDPPTAGIRPKALAWARVSTDEQEERGLSIPEQFGDIRSYAEKHGIEIVAEFHEAASAFRQQHRRVEFQKMLSRARSDRDVSLILVHDLSRFGRDSGITKSQIDELRRDGVRVKSLNDPEIDSETAAGVYLGAITLAKNEAYSREVAFHTRKTCRANVKARDPETGWCYKNGGQPPFGYRAKRLNRGEIKRGRPLIKTIWVPDETVAAGRPMYEWARHCLVELAAKGASLAELRDFCNTKGIPGRRKRYWALSTWNALLQPTALLQFCGYGLWNVRDRRGCERPSSEWVMVENAHQSLISEEEARCISEIRRVQSQEASFNTSNRSRSSSYLLSGGMFKCGRCGANMIGFQNGKSVYYVCGSQPYRRGLGCGRPAVYVPKAQVEAEVIQGIQDLLGVCGNPKGLAKKVNDELRQLWVSKASFEPNVRTRVAAIDQKIGNVRRAIEEGLEDASWANSRLQELVSERKNLESQAAGQPHIDAETVRAYVRISVGCSNEVNLLNTRGFCENFWKE